MRELDIAAVEINEAKHVVAQRNAELEALRKDKNIIRNRLKIYSARKNAGVFLEIQKEFGSLM